MTYLYLFYAASDLCSRAQSSHYTRIESHELLNDLVGEREGRRVRGREGGRVRGREGGREGGVWGGMERGVGEEDSVKREGNS